MGLVVDETEAERGRDGCGACSVLVHMDSDRFWSMESSATWLCDAGFRVFCELFVLSMESDDVISLNSVVPLFIVLLCCVSQTRDV